MPLVTSWPPKAPELTPLEHLQAAWPFLLAHLSPTEQQRVTASLAAHDVPCREWAKT